MPEIFERNVIDEISELIKQLKISEEDFNGRTGGTRPVHAMIINEIREYWITNLGIYISSPTMYDIDFVGREKGEVGRIILASEIDLGSRRQRSWLKLADIRSENKIWIYITKHPVKRAEYRFKGALELIQELLKFREEDTSTFGRFAAIMKTPEIFQCKWLLR